MKISEIITEACWKGYHKEGNKKMFGKTYPNCVKNTNEDQDVTENSQVIKLNDYNQWLDQVDSQGAEKHMQKNQSLIVAQSWDGEKVGEFDLKSNQGWIIAQHMTEGTASGDSSLHDWFTKSKSSDGKPGWVQIGGRYAGKPCAKQPGQKTKPKCGSSKMKRALSKKEEESAARRKRKQDPNPNRSGAAKMVNTKPKK